MKQRDTHRERKAATVQRSTTPPEEEAPAAPHAHVLEMQQLVGNQAVQRMLQREVTSDAPVASSPLKSTIPTLDPTSYYKELEARYQPIRSWLDTRKLSYQVFPPTLKQILRLIRMDCPEAVKISEGELEGLVQQWAKSNQVTLPPSGKESEAELSGILRVKMKPITYPAKEPFKLKGELQVVLNVGKRTELALAVGPSAETLNIAVDLTPDALKKLAELKKNTKLGEFKLEFNTDVTYELETKLNQLKQELEHKSSLNAAASASASWQPFDIPIKLKAEAKASGSIDNEGPSGKVEFTLFKIEFQF